MAKSTKPAKPIVFASHIHAEAELAKLLKDEVIDPHLLGAVDLYVSSDPVTNPGGTSWLKNIEDNLLSAAVLLILASPKSIMSPWINIEAGAAWLRSLQSRNKNLDLVFVMPLCHSGLTPGSLPLPWSTFNAVEIRTQGGLQQIIEVVSRAAGLRAPAPDLSSTAAKVQALERQYMVYTEIDKRIEAIIGVLGAGIVPAFTTEPPPGQDYVIPRVTIGPLSVIDGPLTWLRDRHFIEYTKGTVTLTSSGRGAEQTQDVMIRPLPDFIREVVPHLKSLRPTS